MSTTQTNTARPGYKLTKLGWMPEEWKELILSKILVNYKLGGNYENSDNVLNLPLIKMGNIGRGNIVLTKLERLGNNEIAREDDALKTGDLLFNTRNTLDLVGKVAVWKSELEQAVYNSNLLRLEFDDSVYSNYFMNYCFNSPSTIRNLRRIATGTTSVAAIYTKDLLKVKIPLPPLAEQKKIAEILGTWDEAIAHTTELVAQLKARKKGLMQQLLTGSTRLPGFSGEWKEVRLGDYFTERKETKTKNLPLLSIGRDGVYPQSEDKKDTSNSDKSKYKKICKDDIGYNSMRMWQGRSALSSIEGIVSPAYTIVTTLPIADPLFFSYLFQLEHVIHRFYRNSQGMVSDTWMCKFKDFSLVKVDVPPSADEQTAISEVLTTADQEIQKQEEKLAQLQDTKRGLMQQLLTGEVRVN